MSKRYGIERNCIFNWVFSTTQKPGWYYGISETGYLDGPYETREQCEKKNYRKDKTPPLDKEYRREMKAHEKNLAEQKRIMLENKLRRKLPFRVDTNNNRTIIDKSYARTVKINIYDFFPEYKKDNQK